MITFNYSTVNYFFSNPKWGNIKKINSFVTFGRSAAGVLYRYQKGFSIKQISLSWEGLNEDEKTQMETAFATINTNDFTLTDHKGKIWTARFLVGELNFEEFTDNLLVEENFNISGNTYTSSIRSAGFYNLSLEIEIES